MRVVLSSPAKINLLLAVTGRRTDGFHDLLSVVAPLEFGDALSAEQVERGAGPRFTLFCDDPSVPTGNDNLVLRAAEAFATATGWDGAVRFVLTKRIPVGAGLGGGSSNAVAALRALDRLAGGIAGEERLAALAAGLGSDCALFLRAGPVVMRGRGERVEDLPAAAAARVRGRRVIVFAPGFGIATPWAYARLAARGTDYVAAAAAEARLASWVAGSQPAEALLANNLEAPAFAKHLALPVMLAWLRDHHRLAPRMSGSGSACFALLGETDDAAAIEATVREGWGAAARVVVTRCA